jgi:integrase
MANKIADYDNLLVTQRDILNRENISKRNKSFIIGFTDESFANGLSKGRVLKYFLFLRKLAIWLSKDFDKASIQDIKALVAEIERQSFVPYTKKEIKTILRKLYKWLRGTKEYPPEVEWIKPYCRTIPKVKLPEELLSENDVIKLINAARSPRDKAFLAMLYETGCRIGEILFIKIRQINFDQYGGYVVVDGKTGPRRIRLISSVPYLTDWLNAHPQKNSPDAWLWTGPRCRCLKYNSVLSLFARISKRADIKKHIHPHLFRHSRATFLANHLTEAQMKEYFGWVRSSDMATVYVHLSGRDVDDALLKLHGITKDDSEKERISLKPKTCDKCELSNPSTNLFCRRCGHPLDTETSIRLVKEQMDRKEADNLLDTMLQDPRFKELFLDKVKEILKQP